MVEQRKQVPPTEPSQTAGYPTPDPGDQGKGNESMGNPGGQSRGQAAHDEGPAARTVAGRDTNKDERADPGNNASRPKGEDPDRS
ncbi:hypothetical protein [Gemmata sp.]|uniref:hypothetical protein n=1 Tax=Gemmata sp. TaxID=1914242 RepID=UPI003F70E06D